MSLAVVASVAVIWFGGCQNQLGATATLALAGFWGTAGLLSAKFEADRAREERKVEFANNAFRDLLSEARTVGMEVQDRAEFVDRIHDLASKALDASIPGARR